MTKQPSSAAKKVPKPEPEKLFGQRVRARRTELGITQESLADICQLHWSYVSSVERGVHNLTLQNILILAEGLGVDPGELVQGLSAPSPEHRKRARTRPRGRA